MAIKLNKQFSDIVERGNNANGYYVKYSDGTLECHKTLGGNPKALYSWGTLYYADIDTGEWPVPFTELHNVQTSSNYNQYWIINHNATTTSSGNARIIRPDSHITYYSIQISAIGKWK